LICAAAAGSCKFQIAKNPKNLVGGQFGICASIADCLDIEKLKKK
jgi:hypothetical protein